MNFIRKKKAVVAELESGNVSFVLNTDNCRIRVNYGHDTPQLKNEESQDWVREAYDVLARSKEFQQQVIVKAIELAKADLQECVKETIEALSEVN